MLPIVTISLFDCSMFLSHVDRALSLKSLLYEDKAGRSSYRIKENSSHIFTRFRSLTAVERSPLFWIDNHASINIPRCSRKREHSFCSDLRNPRPRQKVRARFARGGPCLYAFVQVKRVRSAAGVDCAHGQQKVGKPGGRFRASIVPARRR